MAFPVRDLLWNLRYQFSEVARAFSMEVHVFRTTAHPKPVHKAIGEAWFGSYSRMAIAQAPGSEPRLRSKWMKMFREVVQLERRSVGEHGEHGDLGV